MGEGFFVKILEMIGIDIIKRTGTVFYALKNLFMQKYSFFSIRVGCAYLKGLSHEIFDPFFIHQKFSLGDPNKPSK